MSQDKLLREMENIKEEILGLKYTFILAYKEIRDSKMNEVFNTENRKNIWIHFDGNLTQEDLAKKIGTKQKEISRFIIRFTKMGFLRKDENDVVFRVFNYTPNSWI